MGASLTLTGNPIADGIATFFFWYVLAPLGAYWVGCWAMEIVVELLRVDEALGWLIDRFGVDAISSVMGIAVVVGVIVLATLYPPWAWLKAQCNPAFLRMIGPR